VSADASDAGEDGALEPRQGGYYIPLADLLTGLVFILVIMLTAVTITARPEFETQLQIEQTRERLARELARLQSLERTYLEPRETARLAMIAFLEAVEADLRAAGVEVAIDRATGVVAIPEAEMFTTQPSQPPRLREERVVLLARSLTRHLSCVAGGAIAQAPVCAGRPPARLARFVVVVLASQPTQDAVAGARAAILYGRLIEAEPRLTALRDRSGWPAFTHAAFARGEERGARFAIELDRPALPPGNWLQDVR